MSVLRVVTAGNVERKGLLLVSGEPLADPRHHLQAKHLTYGIDDKVSDIPCACSPETYVETCLKVHVLRSLAISVQLQLKPRACFIRELIKQTTCSGVLSPLAVLHEQKLISQENSLTVLTSDRSDTSGLQKGKKAGGCTTEFTMNS